MSSEDELIPDLPILEWEDPTSRVIVPANLADAARLEIRVFRWSREKITAIQYKRPELIDILNQLSDELRGWRYVGEEVKTGNTRILFIGSDNRYYALTLGQDISGSWNAVTIVGSANPRFFVNRLKTLKEVVERNR